MENFETFTIYPMPRKRYAEVKEVLIERGYALHGREWRNGEDCVTITSEGELVTHTFRKLQHLEEPVYTVDEFLTKYGSLTKPLTIGEIHQLRELLKAHSPTTGQPEPKPQTHEGVFSFDPDGANCNYGKRRLYWVSEYEQWAVVTSIETKPHTLIEAPHEVGRFYLLSPILDREDPTNYGLFDGEYFWRWTDLGGVNRDCSATNLKVVKA
jgi:hypothetical protein